MCTHVYKCSTKLKWSRFSWVLFKQSLKVFLVTLVNKHPQTFSRKCPSFCCFCCILLNTDSSPYRVLYVSIHGLFQSSALTSWWIHFTFDLNFTHCWMQWCKACHHWTPEQWRPVLQCRCFSGLGSLVLLKGTLNASACWDILDNFSSQLCGSSLGMPPSCTDVTAHRCTKQGP